MVHYRSDMASYYTKVKMFFRNYENINSFEISKHTFKHMFKPYNFTRVYV